MIRLIIVDDEETTRNSLFELIPWQEMGIAAVKSAKNGLDALELAESFTPSIILCDVRMPKMDGIELAKSIRQLYPECEIIFLSGYSDKDYLKTAIKINAIDYLEKPVDIEELKVVFNKTIQKIKLNKEKAIEEEKLKGSFSGNIHLIRQKILLELISGKADGLSLKDKYGPDVFLLQHESIFTVISVVFNWHKYCKVNDKYLIKNSLLETLNADKNLSNTRFLSGFTDDNHLVLIAGTGTGCTDAYLNSLLKHLFNTLSTNSSGNYSFSIGLSPHTYEIDSLQSAYKASLETLKQQFYRGVNHIYYPVQATRTSIEISTADYSKFKKLLQSGSVQEAIAAVNGFTMDISKSNEPDIGKIKNIYFNFLRILLEVTMQWDTLGATDDAESKYIWQEVDSQATLEGLSDFLTACIKTVFTKARDKEASLKKINEINKYIIEHYMDNQLSILSIAEYAALSQTYLCAFFKKSTGKTLNEYITELRIEKAKELLQDNRLRLYEVVSFIGFTDVNYFSTLFKKHTGLTPSEFREKKMYDKKSI